MYTFLFAASRKLFGEYDLFVHMLTILVLMCAYSSSVSILATLLTFLSVLLLYRVTDICHPRSYLKFGTNIASWEDLKWSIFATPRQRKRRRARLRRRFRRRNGLKVGRKFRRRKLAYHLVMKCRRRVGNKPTTYAYRHEVHQVKAILRREIPLMYRRLKKLKRVQKKLRKARDDALYQSFAVKGVEKFEGYLSPSTTGRFCYINDVSSSTINDFCSSFDPVESFKVMRMIEEERLTLESIGSSNDMDELSLEDHRDIAQDTVTRANMFINTAKAYQSSCDHGKPSFKFCPVVWDTGASFGLTPFREDFITYEEVNISVSDITKTNMVIGIGTVMWKFRTVSGKVIHLPMIAYHLPTTNIRLFSPQTFHQLHGGESSLVSDGCMGPGRLIRMTFQRLDEVETVEIRIDPASGNVPIVEDVSCTDEERAEIGPKLYTSLFQRESKPLELEDQLKMARQALTLEQQGMPRTWNSSEGCFDFDYKSTPAMCQPCIGEDGNKNLSGPQKELLKWHWKLGISMSRIQGLMVEHKAIDSKGETAIFPQVIKPKFRSTSSCKIPLCTSCELARAKRRSPGVSKKIDIEEKQGILACEKYEVGDRVSMDQYVVKTPGRLPTGYGRERPENKYTGGTIFNDAASGAIWVENQVSLGAFETVMSKRKFEDWLYDLARIEVRGYHSDNGVFKAEEFKEDCANLNQSQSFSGVGAQHMNARAERSIQTIMYMARSFLIHTALHWNEFGTDDIGLWPFAVKHAAWLYNRIPNRVTGITPIEMVSQTKTDHRDLLRTHVWGSPTFVLDPKLQDGKKIPKWNSRARVGQFLGFSEEHSSTVALIRHLRTGHVSPQFHIVVDDNFETVYGGEMSPGVYDAICNLLWENNREQYAVDERDSNGDVVYSPPPLDDIWLDEEERREKKASRDRITDRRRRMKLRDQQMEEHTLQQEQQPREPAVSVPRVRKKFTPTHDDEDGSVPDLVSNSDNSDEDSVNSADSSVIGMPIESEGEIDDINVRGWEDHPTIIADDDGFDVPPTPVPPPAPNIRTPTSGNSVPHSTPTSSNNEPRSDREGANDTDELAREQAAADATENISDNNDVPPAQPRRRRARKVYPPKKWTRTADGRLKRDTDSSVHYFGNMEESKFHAYKSTMSKSERSKHEVSLCAEMPSKAYRMLQRISPKRLKFKQRLARMQRKGDELLHADDQLSGEGITAADILKSPLSKFIHLAANECGYNGTIEELVCTWIHPMFLKARSEASQLDNPNWWQAMNGPFAAEYWKAACVEIETLENMEAWEVVDTPEGVKHIDSTWAFKLKRFPDGLIKKFKARLCARGDQQEYGIDYFETYAPVVQWTTVRLMLILEVLLDLKSKQGDVTCAFLHAKVPEGQKIYVNMPMGFRKKGKSLLLKRFLYGLTVAPREFFKYVVEKMDKCGMKQSDLDPCLFVSDKVVCIVYVDDFLFWAKDEKDISELAMRLREEEMDLEQEDDAAGFLGVRLEKSESSGLIEMKQTGLIDRIIETLGLDKGTVNGKFTPAEANPLVKDEDGPSASGDFNYASVVGMLLYLAGHSRPDIAYAVNCCARYMFCPKLKHEIALKRIGRYLKQTRDRGLILNPTLRDGKLSVDCYPDADFAGLYGHENSNDPASAKSRTGFVITVAGCPVLWQSKLQTETALSTMEAEIVALAHSCRELFPVMDLVSRLGPAVGLDGGETNMNVSIHEDNAGALILAQTLPPQYTPRSKHYHIKTVWFREEIVKRGINLVKIETVEQLGDIFTKGLGKVTFEYLRKKLMGW